MVDIDETIKALLTSPLGCAFLLTAEVSGLSPPEIADPATSLQIGAHAVMLIDVWRSDREVTMGPILEMGQQRADLARALLEEPGTSWWFAPLDRDHQVCFTRDGAPPTSHEFVAPDTPMSNFERYAQKRSNGLFTSTLIGGTSSMFAALDRKTGDIGHSVPGPPWASWHLGAPKSARIFEINGPLSWHELCTRYPAEGTISHTIPDFSADDGRLVPDWPAVADDWDAVHLTFGGLLTAEQVRVESPSGWTYFWAWDVEETLWLRWLFPKIERMPDRERTARIDFRFFPHFSSPRGGL